MFAWTGKDILTNLQKVLPNIKIKIDNQEQEILLLPINEYIKKGSDGDLNLINSIPDRMIRAQVKGALLSISTSKYVEKAINGDKNIIDGISDIKLKTKVKAAYLKAKRNGIIIPKFNEEATNDEKTPAKESLENQVTTPSTKSDTAIAVNDKEMTLEEYVEKILAGDEELVNNIESRVLRSKVKAAVIKAKRSK